MAGLMIENRSMDDTIRALPGSPRPVGDSVSGFEALRLSSTGDYAAGEVGAWTVVSDPRARASWSGDVRESLSRDGRRVLGFVVDDLTTTHGFAWSVDGRLVRSAVHVEGEPVEQQGDRLPEEDNLPAPWSEDIIPTLAQRLTGLDLRQLLEASYTVLRLDDRR